MRPGNTVADLGCGSGYFTLKLSAPVGRNGSVVAEDIRRLPLVFLWLRTLQRSLHNVNIVHGEPDNPHLPVQRVNAVLIANTYHEFTNSQAILGHVAASLASGGRLVVLDREPRSGGTERAGPVAEFHEVSSEQVERELRHAGFEIVSRQDGFIQDDPLHANWWIITARKPIAELSGCVRKTCREDRKSEERGANNAKWIDSPGLVCSQLRRCWCATLSRVAAAGLSWRLRPPVGLVRPTDFCSGPGHSDWWRRSGRSWPCGDG